MIDVHAHLSERHFPDLEEVLSRAKNAGVMAIINSTTVPGESPYALRLFRQYSGYVFLTIGFDPVCTSVHEFENFVKVLESERSNIVGIGEVGIDHFYTREDEGRQVQREFFLRCIELALKFDLPMVIHSRSAGKKALQILSSAGVRKVLMHAFDGKAGDAEKAARDGYYFSIPPSITHSEQKQKLAKLLPLESMMLESDSPALSPIKGERNEPANILLAASKIAEIKRVPLREVVTVTTENAMKFFNLKFLNV